MLGDLDSQLTRRREDEGVQRLGLVKQALDDGHRKGPCAAQYGHP